MTCNCDNVWQCRVCFSDSKVDYMFHYYYLAMMKVITSEIDVIVGDQEWKRDWLEILVEELDEEGKRAFIEWFFKNLSDMFIYEIDRAKRATYISRFIDFFFNLLVFGVCFSLFILIILEQHRKYLLL